MTSFNVFHVVVIFIISFNLLIKTSPASESLQPAQAPSPMVKHGRRPPTYWETYLINCSRTLKPYCAKEVYFAIFIGNVTVSNYCCMGVANDMGRPCLLQLTWYILRLPMFEANKTQIMDSELPLDDEYIFGRRALYGHKR
ncbi:hypothetical protein CR513_02219, partial [Mucuna pruriens]